MAQHALSLRARFFIVWPIQFVEVLSREQLSGLNISLLKRCLRVLLARCRYAITESNSLIVRGSSRHNSFRRPFIVNPDVQGFICSGLPREHVARMLQNKELSSCAKFVRMVHFLREVCICHQSRFYEIFNCRFNCDWLDELHSRSATFRKIQLRCKQAGTGLQAIESIVICAGQRKLLECPVIR